MPDFVVPLPTDVAQCFDLDAVPVSEIIGGLAVLPPSAGGVEGMIRAFRPTAKTLVVEEGYYDLDYRSEFTATHETSFALRNPSTRRMHFFASSCTDFKGTLLELILSLAESYLGYAVLRPQYPGTIGRSLVSPVASSVFSPGDLKGHRRLEGKALERRVRTAVEEVVELFGVPLRAVGVPYMEQDGHLLTCAHVSAWLCHYTAVLRGRVPRRTSAAFHLAEDETGSYGRQYPSAGLSTHVLSRILRKLGLPPEIIDLVRLSKPRNLTWYDRESFVNDLEELNERVRLRTAEGDELDRAWITENLTSSVCRYLNSGIPVIIADDLVEHTRVVCGYVRGMELDSLSDESTVPSRVEQSKNASVSSSVEALILQDDGEQPFVIESVESIVSTALDDEDGSAHVALVIPLPRGLWLEGDSAERHGAAVFHKEILRRHKSLDGWFLQQEEAGYLISGEQAALYQQTYDELAAAINPEAHSFAIRSYVSSGSEFKVSMRHRLDDSEVAADLGYTQLSRFVWVVELIKRELRTADDTAPCVYGTVVLDASVVSSGSSIDESFFSVPLFVHLVGQTARLNDPQDELMWRPASLAPYPTGRWRHDAPWLRNKAGSYISHKGAV